MIKAKLSHLHIAPRKVRLVGDLIRGKRVEDAQGILNFTTKKSARFFLKVLNSAVANAKNNFKIDHLNLYISNLLVDEGPKMKRWRPRSRGSANQIQKKTSHITITLKEIEGAEKKETTDKKGKLDEKIVKQKKISKIEDKVSEKTIDKEDIKTTKIKKQEKRAEFETAKSQGKIQSQKIFRRKSF